MTEGEAGFTKDSILGESGEKRPRGSRSKNALPDQPPKQPLCPQCGSVKVWKDGLRYDSTGIKEPVQRLLCRVCGYRFSEPNEKVNISGQRLKMSKSETNHLEQRVIGADFSIKEVSDSFAFRVGENSGVHEVTCRGKNIYAFVPSNSNRRVCESETRDLRNLTEEATRKEWAAGATTTDQANIKGKIVEYALWLKRQGKAETTIITRTVILKVLLKRGADLLQPEKVKDAIANQNWSNARKMNAVYAYQGFLDFLGMTWELPTYTQTKTIPFIPTEQEIEALIAGCGKKMSTKLQLLKETAMRSGEARQLKWTDIDTVNRVIRVNSPEKGSNPRVFKVSEKLISMLNSLPKKSLRVFGDTALATDNKNFYLQRKALTRKLSNPRLLQIHFHTLRHWKATTLYHQTKDIIYVKEFLGHKRIETTLLYIQIERAYFGHGDNDEFMCKIAKTPEEVKELVEAGFDYVTELNGDKFFRKRK